MMKKPDFTSPALLISATVIVAALPYLAVGIFESSLYHVMALPSYLVFHNLTEFYSVIVSFSIFGLGWYAYDQNKDRHSLFLSTAFFGIGLMDFMHTLGYAGMPAFISQNDTNKAILFWISVRLFGAAAFLASAHISPSSRSRWLSKAPLFTITLLISFAVFVAVIFFPDYIPAAFIPGTGLTPFKRYAEYFIIFLLVLASIKYVQLLSVSGNTLIRYYLVAFIICIFSELSFTLYKSAFDTYNMLGHIYKTIAFMLIYKGVFVAAVRKPYEDLRQNRNMLSHIMNSVPQSIFWKDRNSQFLGCNHVFAQQAGIDTPDDIVGKSDFDLPWGVEASEGFRADDRDVMQSGTAKLHIIEKLCKADGETIWVDTTKIPLVDARGAVEGVLGVYEDVTQRMRAEKDLKDSLLFNQQIIDCVQEGIIVYDLELRYQVWNPFMEKLTGVKAEDVLGRTPLEVFPFLRDSGVIEALNMVLEGRTAKSREFRYDIPSTGASGWVVDTSAPLLNAKGKVIGIIGVVRDISENRAIVEQLQHAQKMESVGRLAGGVAHDFNNMLSVILGNAELGLINLDESHPVYPKLIDIRDSAEKSADLTRQLLAFARKQAVIPKVIDLNEVISRMFKILKRLIGEDIGLNLHTASDLWAVKIDPSQIDQILANLCVNARDAINGNGEITIETENSVIDEAYCSTHLDAKPGEYLLLSVSDNGSGMDRDTISHVFEPFFSTKGYGKGTGLGLATVYGAVKQNSGFINVYSEVGKGTVFSIYLPRYHDKEELLVEELETDTLPRGSETILLVEDESSILTMASAMLSELGYTILSAGSPAEAIKIASDFSGDIQLLLTDVIMPEMSGKDVAERIRDYFPQMKCLFMSGYTADVIATQGILSEGTMFIHKPFTVKSLASKIRTALNS